MTNDDVHYNNTYNTQQRPLQWPSISTRILIRKLSFLAKLLSDRNDTINGRIFTSIAIVDVNNVGIVQQCRMLEVKLDTHILTQCLKYPTDSPAIVKQSILRSDYEKFLSVSSIHPSAKHVATMAQSTLWSQLRDMALQITVFKAHSV